MERIPSITPGEILLEEFLIPMNITAYRLAKLDKEQLLFVLTKKDMKTKMLTLIIQIPVSFLLTIQEIFLKL